MKPPKFRNQILTFLLPFGAAVALLFAASCDTRSPGEKIEDGIEDIGRGNVSDGLEEIGEGLEDAVE